MIQSKISTICTDEKSGIAVLTIENGRKNLLTEPEFIETDVLLDFINDNPELRGLIITGEGRHFSHGADISEFNSQADIAIISEKLKSARKLLMTIENLPIITAAAVNGGCFGGGFEIALSCDFRICSKNAFLGLPEVMHGVIPGINGTERLTRLIGKEKALSMILNGEIISAETAYERGIVSLVTDSRNCLKDTLDFISGLTENKTPLQIRCILEAINTAMKISADPPEEKFEEVLSELISKSESDEN